MATKGTPILFDRWKIQISEKDEKGDYVEKVRLAFPSFSLLPTSFARSARCWPLKKCFYEITPIFPLCSGPFASLSSRPVSWKDRFLNPHPELYTLNPLPPF